MFSLSFARNTSLSVAANVALLRPAVQRDTFTTYTTFTPKVASNAVDGNLYSSSCTLSHTSTEPWLSVDLRTPLDVGRVCIINDDYYYGWPCQIFYLLSLSRFICLSV